jgi:hypothetical protein
MDNDENIPDNVKKLLEDFNFDYLDDETANDQDQTADIAKDFTFTVDDYNAKIDYYTKTMYDNMVVNTNDMGIGHISVVNNSPYIFTSADIITFDVTGTDTRLEELEAMEAEVAEEARLRSEHPAVDELYQQYRLGLALVKEQPSDQYFEDRMRAFGGKVDEE